MQRSFDRALFPFDSNDAIGTERYAPPPPQPDYNSQLVQEALEHLATIDLNELCNEAKIERCRASRDLRSCGRSVHYVLNSCGHASLCEECTQRCDCCPICRIPIPKNGSTLQLRLYYECINAGLISKRHDDRVQEKEDDGKQLTSNIDRLYLLFDVAMENNLVSLICHYVTDVCMDETAVSSDPVISFLLDEVVVKDWCKRTFKNILIELQGIYNLEIDGMRSKLSLLLKFSMQLSSIISVIEVLESSFKGTLSAQLHDLHHLQECLSKTKQHIEIMTWCVRHQFLENVKSRYTNFKSWELLVRERRSAAVQRSWPDSVNHSAEFSRKNGSTLFIEDALSNLEIDQRNTAELGEELEVLSSQKEGSSSFSMSKIEGMVGCYPFENLRSATDILFLRGSSDLVVAKRAIFLYYLFDRHWTVPDDEWRPIIDDFAAAFSITRHSLLESFIFYLLDDHTEEALQEACRLLPEISGPTTHPKIAEVLLERQNPDSALMVLRWSGLDGAQSASLADAVTAVRVRIECGLLTEAFMHQRTLCIEVKEKKVQHGSFGDDLTGECKNWMEWVESLVTEICYLCIRRNLVDRMIELPWNSDEEKYLHKCLFDYAVEDPSTTIGSLLVVFYLQRYRYIEAYQVDRKLQRVEQDCISDKSKSEELLLRMRSTRQWRAGLVDKCIELLPEVQRQEVKSGNFPEIALSPTKQIELSIDSDLSMKEVPKTSFVLQMDHGIPSQKPSVITETPLVLGASVNNGRFDIGNYGPSSILHGNILTYSEEGVKSQSSISKNFKFFDDISTPSSRVFTSSKLKEMDRSSSQVIQSSHNKSHKSSPELEQNGVVNQFQSSCPPYSRRTTANPISMPSSNDGLYKGSALGAHRNMSAEWVVSSDDLMDVSWSNGDKGCADVDPNVNGMLRWRSDDGSEDDEGEKSLERIIGVASHTTRIKGVRRSRFTRR